MQTRKAATDTHATTSEIACAQAAADMSAAKPAANMTTATEPAPVSASAAAARKRVGGQSPVRAVAVNNAIMDLRNIGILLRTRLASI